MNTFHYRVEFTSKRGKIGGDKRKLTFQLGDKDQMELKVTGLINKDAVASIAKGLPNTSSNDGSGSDEVISSLFRTNQQQQHSEEARGGRNL